MSQGHCMQVTNKGGVSDNVLLCSAQQRAKLTNVCHGAQGEELEILGEVLLIHSSAILRQQAV